MTAEEQNLRLLVRRVRIDKILPPLPNVDDTVAAPCFGISTQRLRALRGTLAEEVDRAAEALLSDPSIADLAARLPFQKRQTVVGVGDGLTADTQSWFEVMGRVVQRARPQAGVRFVNAAAPGETTTQMLARLPAIVALRPSHVICLAGSNDARRFGSERTAPQVSSGETERNLFEMRQALTHAEWLTVVPPPVIFERLRSSPFATAMRIHWDESDLESVRNLVRLQDTLVLELNDVFGTPPRPDFFLDDGLHLTLAGHVEIAKSVIRALVPAPQHLTMNS